MTEHPPRDAAITDVVQQLEGAGESVRGTVRVAPAVLIQLIELTVNDIDGVVELRPRPKKTRQPHEVEGKSYDDGKVRVGVIGDRIETDIAVSVKHGVNIAELSTSIQHRVGGAVERMLGMSASSVNIFIDDIKYDDDGDSNSRA